MTTLLDGNVLVALMVADHVHHEAAEIWFETLDDGFASCPITQGTLMRLVVRQGESAQTAKDALTALSRDQRHEFWPDEISYTDVSAIGIIGHRQVTDTYLAALARHREGRLATFDRGLVNSHPDVAELIPVDSTSAAERSASSADQQPSDPTHDNGHAS